VFDRRIRVGCQLVCAILCLVISRQFLNRLGPACSANVYAATAKGSQKTSSGGNSDRKSLPSHTMPGNVYYVSTNGNDSAPGDSRASPWRSIQHAAQAMNPGDTTIVEAGRYDERVVITKSGGPGKTITFTTDRGALVQMRGFRIMADYMQVMGFDITNQYQTPQQGWGMYVIGSHNLITHNHIHNLCFEGIYLSGNGNRSSGATAYNTISHNTITRAEMAGVHIEGQSNLIERNDVGFTRQYPPNCPARNGADADGFRFFGNGHSFISNRIHDIAVAGSLYNPNPHTDCFQSWGPATNVTFDSNWCQWPAPRPGSGAGGNEIGMVQNFAGNVSNLLFMNNVFINMGKGLIVQGDSGPIVGLRFFNNTVDNVIQEGLILHNVSGARIVNNIFHNVGSGSDNYLVADRESQNFVAESNDMYMSNGSEPGSYGSTVRRLKLDPQFLNRDGFDLHLTAVSGLIGVGMNLPEVRHDFDGMPRPQAKPYDLGAFQHR
jgi:Right handed beta helix region